MSKVSFDSARQFLADAWNVGSQAAKVGFSDSVIWVQKTANAYPLTTVVLANSVSTFAVKTIIDKFSGEGTSNIKKLALRVTASAVLVGGNYLLLGALGLSITTLPVALAVGSGVVIGLLVVSYRHLRNENKQLEEKLEMLDTANIDLANQIFANNLSRLDLLETTYEDLSNDLLKGELQILKNLNDKRSEVVQDETDKLNALLESAEGKAYVAAKMKVDDANDALSSLKKETDVDTTEAESTLQNAEKELKKFDKLQATLVGLDAQKNIQRVNSLIEKISAKLGEELRPDDEL